MGRFSVEDDDSDDEMSVIEDTALHVVTSQMNASINSNASLNHHHRHDRSFFETRDDDPNTDARSQFNSHPMDHYKDHDHLDHFPVARQTKGYRKQFVFLVLLIALQHYMPPPPPPFDTWTDYVSHSTEGFKATLTNFTLLAWYIVSGCVNNMHQDGKLRIHALLSEKKGHLHLLMPCPLALPKSSDSFNAMDAIQTRIKDRIVAQDSAIELISRALILWNLGETNLGTSTSTNDNAAGVKRPLNMIFTGSHGVGKYEVAKQVVDIMLNSCRIESFPEEFSCATPACNRDNSDRILDIAGIEYALEEENYERALSQRILDHIYSQKGAGAIVIIRHVENLSMGAKLELVRLLSKRNVIFTPTKTIDDNGFSFGSMFGMENDFRNEREVEIRLDNSVFVMTTDLGADKIFGGLRNHVFQARALHDTIQVEVEQDVKQYFGVKIFDVIAPFWPLQYSDIIDIVKRKARMSSRYKVELLDSAAEYLASPNLVEYFEMKVMGDEPFIFARGGGHDLGQGAIIKAVEERLEDDSFFHVDEVARIGYHAGEWTMQLCNYGGGIDSPDEGDHDVVCIDRSPLIVHI